MPNPPERESDVPLSESEKREPRPLKVSLQDQLMLHAALTVFVDDLRANEAERKRQLESGDADSLLPQIERGEHLLESLKNLIGSS